MRYSIGLEIIDKSSKHSESGLYGVSLLGFRNILTKENIGKYIACSDKPQCFVFEDATSAELFARMCTRRYRRDDVCTKEWKSRKIRNFYPIKIDSLNFPFLIARSFLSEDIKPHKMYIDCYNNSTKRTTCEYSIYNIIGVK